MNDFSLGDLIVPLSRPEYPSSPEIFLTSMAWRHFEVPEFDAKTKRRFRRHQRGSEGVLGVSGRSAYQYSWDSLLDPSSGFAQNLQLEGINWSRTGSTSSEQLSSELLRAVLSGISGTTSEKSDSISVAPLVPGLALLQTVSGMKGTSANFAGIFEQFGALGGYQDGEVSSAWLRSTDQIKDSNPFLRALDNALDRTSGFGPRVSRKLPKLPEKWTVLESLRGLQNESPFGWFARSWTNLNSESWVNSLPPRVWADWASSLLRTAFGFSYLWEAHWYHRLADLVLSENEITVDDLGRPFETLLPWVPAELPISLRGVKGYIDKTIRTGGEISGVFTKKFEEIDAETLDWDEGLKALRSDKSFRRNLSDAKNLPTKRQTSTVEAVTYSLNIRKEFGEGADYFGLLSLKSRKYRIPDPGTEWLAMMVSLASAQPGGVINMGKLVTELNSVGLNPPTGELIRKLEQAGLARGSSDSDFGMEIETAF